MPGPTIPNLDDNLACSVMITSTLPVVSVTASCGQEDTFAVTCKEIILATKFCQDLVISSYPDVGRRMLPSPSHQVEAILDIE